MRWLHSRYKHWPTLLMPHFQWKPLQKAFCVPANKSRQNSRLGNNFCSFRFLPSFSSPMKKKSEWTFRALQRKINSLNNGFSHFRISSFSHSQRKKMKSEPRRPQRGLQKRSILSWTLLTQLDSWGPSSSSKQEAHRRWLCSSQSKRGGGSFPPTELIFCHFPLMMRAMTERNSRSIDDRM